ncbi:DUF5713 family protein [Polyangium sp. y55x31]|uniref:DUF5713 family protein n=1 Tax=Polyangium sp. y55x31 TaxID=3042688 RepID=UPI0024824437|nr:DUF5713 family protein [Polyangium sp. y55x31]MDI1477941.1 DUF5713 family protein [Polyangium sp. y55x31]
MTIKNEAVRQRKLLEPMIEDDYYPKHLVEKGQQLLVALAERVEKEAPKGTAVYALTHATTEAFNELQEEFFEEESEIETVAREAIAEDIGFILDAYGYEFDIEEAIAPRDW